MNIIPIFETSFFPTLDGPAHLYNSNLIQELWFGHNDFLSTFFTLNSDIIPNWIGHFLLAIFKLILPAAYAEKALLVIYFIGLPLSFRWLIKTVAPRGIGFSYIIFPFLYSAVFAMGFYNFSLALILLFLTLTFWLKNSNNLNSYKSLLILFLLITVTFFAHLFVFVFTLFALGMHIVYDCISSYKEKKSEGKQELITFLKKAGWLFLVSFIPIVFLFLYYLNRTPSGNNEYLSNVELWNALKNLDTLIAYDRNAEQMYTRKIFYLFIALVVFVLGNFAYSKLIKKEPINFRTSGFWGLITIFTLVLYFIIPDSDETAGYVSSRLGLLFYLFLGIWLSTQKVHWSVQVGCVLSILFLNYKLINYHKSQTIVLDEVAMECYQASRFIKPNSVVLPIDVSNHWVLKHFSNYLGVDKPVVILENYEASTGYFPVVWNEKEYPRITLGANEAKNVACLYWKSNDKGKVKKADYVFIIGDFAAKIDSCNVELLLAIKEEYTLKFYSKNTKLYGLK